jgi:hypothetical protein
VLIVGENAHYSHFLTNEELGKIVVAHGGKFQSAAINTATDVVVLGDVGPRDKGWGESHKAEDFAAQLAADADGSRAKSLSVVQFSSLAANAEVRAASVTCGFGEPGSKAYQPPGETRTRGRLMNIIIYANEREADGKSKSIRGLCDNPTYMQ